MITLDDIYAAQSRLHGITNRTCLIELDRGNAYRRLFLKPENQQPIGAFKLR
jgi:threonine dehydratase